MSGFQFRPLPVSWIAALAICSLAAPIAADEPEPWTDGYYAPPYACRANFSLAGQQELFAELQQLQVELARKLVVPPTSEPVELYLFRDKATYKAYLAARYPDVPFRRALFVKGAGPGLVYAYQSDDFEIDVRHESTHALLHAVLPSLPLWLDEGLAEYFEAPADKREYDHPHLAAVKWSARFGYVPPLSSLEVLQDLGEMGRAEYRHAWAWVHFMLHASPEAHQELVHYLADLRRGAPTALLSERLASRVPDLEERFSQHFLEWKR